MCLFIMVRPFIRGSFDLQEKLMLHRNNEKIFRISGETTLKIELKTLSAIKFIYIVQSWSYDIQFFITGVQRHGFNAVKDLNRIA